jgi:small GTP-binding protein
MSDSHGILKIGIVGLENAGKTTMIQTLRQNFKIALPIGSTPPTKSVERTPVSIFGQETTIWDYGGQEVYRKIYLENPERYLSEIRYLFFVVDMQDPEKFDKALAYFEEIYGHLLELHSKAIISIFFHKIDPRIKSTPDIIERIQILRDRFQNVLTGIEVGFYETSCLDPLTVLSACSLPILGAFPIYNEISVLFAEFAMEHEIEYINLIVDDLFEVGAFRLIKAGQNFLPASQEFYQEMAEMKFDTKLKESVHDQYIFFSQGHKVSSHDTKYNYRVNLAFPANLEKPPKKKDLHGLNKKINKLFEKYHPQLY